MDIPPISSSSSNVPAQDPDVTQFYQMWTAWFNETDPSKAKADAEALLKFLNNPTVAAHLASIAANYPPSKEHPSIDFANALKTAKNYLENWINSMNTDSSSGDKTPTSEFLKDVYNWINY